MPEPLPPVRVWDLPTRLFHWILAGCIVGSVVSAKIGGNAMVWHFRLGYVVLTLILFRLVWGLVGGHCIGVDPYYLAQRAVDLGHDPRVILAGRSTNDGMADWVGDAIHAAAGARARRRARRVGR